MKKSIHNLWMILLWVTFFSCEQEEHSISDLQGTIRFGGISLKFAPMGSTGSRIAGNSPWVHVFPNSADLIFTNKVTSQQYVLNYNPNDFSVPYSITLPFGAYEYRSIVDGGIFSPFLPFEAWGEFVLESQSLEISLEAETDFGLVTLKDQYVENASISDGESESDLIMQQDGSYRFLYVKGGTSATLNIKESFQGTSIVREPNITANSHYNFVLKLTEGAAIINDVVLAPFELEEEEIFLGLSSKFFEENGTVKCPGAIPGEKGMVNDKIYEAVDRALLSQRRNEGAELSCVCTTLVTDMSQMFHGATSFNQPIGNWDVSNVTNMKDMFFEAINFNQPICNWDVSNVTDMSAMFFRAASFNQPIESWDVGNVTSMGMMFSLASNFNQPIGNWNISNVTDMSGVFSRASNFNQPIGCWDVSNVTDMSFIFSYAASFNQPIGNWNVGNVRDMSYMFDAATSFNQPIGNWDVSKVTSMYVMLRGTENFNQPIGNWDVSNVKEMNGMFAGASNFNQPICDWDVINVIFMDEMFFSALKFNQDLSSWCVQKIPSEPKDFSTESALAAANKPIWGTCPE